MRSTLHLLILDNLESITGTHFAIRNTLSTREQKALQGFLAELVGGKTLVLLGSRGDEAWLAPGTFENNRYDLGGLDNEAATRLAERILARHGATQYRQSADLLRLLKLLDGFPLALEVVLANLARQAPAEILAALHAGDISLDTPGQTDKTTSILQCIDYSHSNLSAEAQNLLLYFAPFTTTFDAGLLEAYTKHLQAQAVLADLPFERWSDVLREARNWGLLTPDATNPRFLHLQPVLPYFLQNRLRAPELQERRAAIEHAFRRHYEEIGVHCTTFSNQSNPKRGCWASSWCSRSTRTC